MSEFPEIQPIGNLSVQLLIGQPSFAPEAPQPQAAASAYRFSDASGARFVQVSKNQFVYQTTEVYKGWAPFKEKLMDLWSISGPALDPGTIAKIGLRYINRIAKRPDRPHLSDWLRPTHDLPEALFSSKEHFLGRIEASPASSHLRLITLANEPATPERPDGGIIFDIDRITTEQFAADPATISEKLEILHEDIWATFSAAHTATLKQHLTGSAT